LVNWQLALLVAAPDIRVLGRLYQQCRRDRNWLQLTAFGFPGACLPACGQGGFPLLAVEASILSIQGWCEDSGLADVTSC
jgi:hypothetical protein